jgi:hypothetical protein
LIALLLAIVNDGRISDPVTALIVTALVLFLLVLVLGLMFLHNRKGFSSEMDDEEAGKWANFDPSKD